MVNGLQCKIFVNGVMATEPFHSKLLANHSISVMWSRAHIAHISKTCEDFGMNKKHVLSFHEGYMHKNFMIIGCILSEL